MRRWVLGLLALLSAGPAWAQGAQGAPPHAWLFGVWTGGMFPAPTHFAPGQCVAQATVVFLPDEVRRSVLTQEDMVSRTIETARATPSGTDFRFAPLPARQTPMFGGVAPPTGFGCDSADELAVQKLGTNEIRFPGCKDFPYPLVRCEMR